MAKYRRERINDAVAKELAISLRELRDPRITSGFVSITRAEVAPDLKFARVYFSAMGDEKEVAAALKKATGYFRRHLATTLNLLIYNALESSRHNAPGIGSTGDKQVPYGIVMMDYVGDSSTNGDKAINAIISSNFESQNVTGVEDVELESDGVVTADVVGYYNLSGQLVGKPTKGQVVVAKYSDGSARKLVF